MARRRRAHPGKPWGNTDRKEAMDLTRTTQASQASILLAAAGVEEDPSFYGPFISEEEKVILTVPQRIQAAWAANDADFFAEVFTENGSLLMQDHQLTSREQIRKYMTAGFTGPLRGARVKGWPLAVRHLGRDAGLAVTQGGIVLAGETEIALEREIRATWVVVRDGDRWQLMSHHSCPVYG